LTCGRCVCTISTQQATWNHGCTTDGNIGNLEGLVLVGDAQIRLIRFSRISLPPGASTRSAGMQNYPVSSRPVVQNKANLPKAKLVITGFGERGYEKTCGLSLCENKANFQGRDCFVGLWPPRNDRYAGGEDACKKANFPTWFSHEMSSRTVDAAWTKGLSFTGDCGSMAGSPGLGLAQRQSIALKRCAGHTLRRFNGSSKRVPHA